MNISTRSVAMMITKVCFLRNFNLSFNDSRWTVSSWQCQFGSRNLFKKDLLHFKIFVPHHLEITEGKRGFYIGKHIESCLFSTQNLLKNPILTYLLISNYKYLRFMKINASVVRSRIKLQTQLSWCRVVISGWKRTFFMVKFLRGSQKILFLKQEARLSQR